MKPASDPRPRPRPRIRAHARAFAAAVALASTCAATSIAITWTSPAHAQTATDRETARALFDDGKTKRDAGNVAGALESFKAADAIMHAPTTGLAVARSLVALGRLVEGRDVALQIDQIPQGAKESPAFVDARKSARELATDLGPRIPSLVITFKGVPQGPDPSLTIDGVAIPPGAAKAPRRLDPGKHVVVAKIWNGQVTNEVTLAERDTKTVELDVTEVVTPKTVAPAPKPQGTDTGKGAYSPLLWVGLGVAVAGTAAGSVTGLLSMGKASDVEGDCKNDKCPPKTHDALDSARSLATISTISFIVGGAGAGLAVVALVMGRRPREQATAATHVTPWIGAGSAGVVGSF